MSEKRLFDYLHDQLATCPQEKAFGSKVNGEWHYISTAQMVEWVNRLSAGLLNAGLKPGDKVATVVNKTTPQWVAVDLALMQIGVLNVPMYPTISAREYEYILNESECVLCFVGDNGLYDKVAQAKLKTPSLRDIYCFQEHKIAPLWSTLMAPEGADLTAVENIKATIKSGDLCTLIYTSGTTGNPKGVMLTHRNIGFNVESIQRFVPIGPGDRVLSFLPVSHVLERAAVYFYTLCGVSVSFTGTDNLGGEDGDLKAIRPHFFTCVPRLLEKVYDRIYNKGLELSGIKRALFFWAIDMTENWDFDQKTDFITGFKRKIADKLIFSKWREALGGNVKGIITGASACPVKIMRVFNAAGIPVREAYGMTEVAPGISINRYEPGHSMLGTVGPIFEGVTVKIDTGAEYRQGEGEILVLTPGAMLGYYKQPEKTDEMVRVIDGIRWIATGDVGTFVKNSRGVEFLKITDRKKELLKSSGGKYIAPTPIESAFKEHRLVEQIMIVGENLKFVSALIVPAEEGLRAWCQKHGITWTNMKEMVKDKRVIERYYQLAERINPYFSHYEQVRKIALLPDQWESVKSDGTEGELTPTLKLKRRVIMQKFSKEIEEMYD
ncbi:MAG: long-chain fatty acid--CoA ligase [Saprospiraceae bacterium]|nr:long-chain fatty acid--CoA ligase [Saprospiraceae bacterium]